MQLHKYLLIVWTTVFVSANSQALLKGLNPKDLNSEDLEKRIELYKDFGRGSGVKLASRWLHYHRGRFDEFGNLNYTSSSLSVNDLGSREELPQWWPLGPFDWNTVPENGGDNPGLGRLTSVRVAPSDSNIIFVCTPRGGLWKSTDRGKTWSTSFDNMPVMSLSDIAIHPTDPNILYLATGDRDGLDIYGMGVWKSTDGGKTWQDTDYARASTSYNYLINRITFNPDNSESLLFACPRGIYRTYDGGEEFNRIFQFPQSFGTYTNCQDVLFHPNDTNIIYGAGSHFLVSYDGGENFSQYSNGLPAEMARCEIAVSADQPDWVYVLAADISYNYAGIFKSTDQGRNFTLVSDPSVNILGYSTTGDDDRSQALYDLALIADQNDANHIMTGGINLWGSHDGGVTMENINKWQFDGESNYTHADIHWIVQQGEILYLGSDGGIFISHDFGDSWVDYSKGLSITEIYAMELDTVYDRIFFGSQDNGVVVYRSGIWEHIQSGDGFVCAPRADDSSVFMVATQFGHLWRTKNNGNSFVQRDPGIDGQWQTPYVRSRLNEDVLYAGYNELYISEDDGLNWYIARDTLSDQSDYNRADDFEVLEVTGSQEQIIYASKGRQFLRSEDKGRTWDISTLSGTITDIIVDPYNENNVFVSLAGSRTNKFNYSNDGGLSFENSSDSLPNIDAYSLVYEKNRDGRIYIGLDQGVYYKDTLMDYWKPFMNGLPNVRVTDMEINYGKGICVASTYGRGMWQFHLRGNVGIQELNEGLNMEWNLYPNPAIDEVRWSIERPIQDARIYIWSLAGIKIAEKPIDFGQMQGTLFIGEITPGIYFVSIESNKKKVTRRLLIE